MCGVLVQQDTRTCYIFTPSPWMFPLSHQPCILTRCVQFRPACASASEFSPSRSSSATHWSCVISSISFWLSWAIMCRCKWLLPQGPGERRQTCWCSPSNGNDLSFQTLINMGKKKIQSTSFFLQSAHSPQRTEFFHRYRRMCFNSIPLPGAVLGADCSSCRASRECSIHKEGLNRLELQEAVKDWCNAKPEFENIWGNATVLQGDFKSYRLKALVNQGTVCGQ